MSSDPSLLEFLKNNPTMFQNYQAIVIKILLESDSKFSATINEIKNKIVELNFDREDFKINSAWSTVKKVLDDHNVISINGENVKLNNENISDVEKTECLKICGQKIVEFHIDKIVKGDYNLWRMPPGSAKESYPFELEFLKSNTIGVGWGKIGDDVVKKNMTKEQTEELFHKLYRPIDGVSNSPQSFTNFTHEIKPKDIIVLIKKKTILDFAIVVGSYHYQKDPSIDLPDNAKSYSHRRNVVWLNRGPIPESEAFEFSRMSACDRVKDTQLKEQYIAILGGGKLAKYFLLRHNSKGPWKADTGKKYHLTMASDGSMKPRFREILDAGVGTKTIWYTTSNGQFYFWGYGTVTGIEDVKEDSEWYLTYNNFKLFEGDTNIQGRKLKRTTTSVNQQLQDLQHDKKWNFNWRYSINPISKKLYQQIIGEDLISEEDETDIVTENNYDRALKMKPNLILYGPPGTGKTFIAKKIAERKAKNSKIWLWAVTPENWKVVLERKVWGSGDEINKLRKHISKNDIVVFYVNTTHEIQGIFKFSGDWYQAKEDIWDGDGLVGNDIIIDEICLGHVDVRNLHDKLDLFKGATSLNAINARLQSKGKIRRGPSAELTRKDFNIISKRMGVTVETQFTRMVTFHPSYSYEDFVEGFRPKVDGSGSYLLQNGIFKQICIDAEKDPDNTYVIIIDEINRGNIPKIFGELITLIEKDKRYQKDSLMLTYSQNPFFVPENLIIIGTMNTADKSLMQMDDALKRRFVFEELMPDTKLLLDHLKENNVTNAEYYSNILNRINEKILGTGTGNEIRRTKQFRDRQIGHSYFWDICKDGKSDPDDDLQNIIKYDIIPLLQDYFYGDYSEIQKIFSKKDSDDDYKDNAIIGDDNRPTELVTKESKSKLLREALQGI